LKLDIEGIKKREAAPLRQLMVVVKRCAHIACLKIGTDSWEDDLAQEVYMLFIEKLIHRFDEAYNAEPYLIEISRFVALNWVRKHKKEVSFGEIFGSENEEEMLSNGAFDDINMSNRKLISAHDLDSENPVSSLDQRKALESAKTMLAKKETINSVIASNLELESELKMPRGGATAFILRPAATKKVTLGPHAQRLAEIRQNIGLSLEKFAGMLEISNARLATYIYGRHDFQPDKRPGHAEIMRRAEDLAANYKDLVTEYKKNDKLSIKQWLKKWAKQICVEPDDYDRIALVAGVHVSTVWRWARGDLVPPPHHLRIYIYNFDEAENRLKEKKQKKAAKEG
jgi:DNA-directed RNA polymerase specialized sigma24 family protein/transcriptional regulator with XRE-family HTH domain